MRIVPVIDLMQGQVVRAVAGRREAYRPLEWPLCRSSRPADVAAALVTRYGFDELYVADLDAIGGHAPAVETYRELAAILPRLWIDSGLRDAEGTGRLAEIDCGANPPLLVVGLESVVSPSALREIAEEVDRSRLAFSLDLMNGSPFTKSPHWDGLNAEQIAAIACEARFARLIVLDLSAVGMRGGVATLDLCRRLRANWPEVELISGGGVRNDDDVRQLAEAGCDAALVASAIYGVSDQRLAEVDSPEARRYFIHPSSFLPLRFLVTPTWVRVFRGMRSGPRRRLRWCVPWR